MCISNHQKQIGKIEINNTNNKIYKNLKIDILVYKLIRKILQYFSKFFTLQTYSKYISQKAFHFYVFGNKFDELEINFY